MMKSFILIAVLAALTVCIDAASTNEAAPLVEDIIELPEGVEQYEYTKDYNQEGVTGRQSSRNNDFILFYEESFNLEPIPHTIQHRDIFYRGNSTTHIRQVRTSYSPIAVPPYIFTGMYVTHARVRVTSGVGEGLRGTVQFSGIYTDWQ